MLAIARIKEAVMMLLVVMVFSSPLVELTSP